MGKDRGEIIAEMLEAGATNKEIAARIGVTPGRVVQLIYRALGRCACGKKELATETMCARCAKAVRDSSTRARERDREGWNRRVRESRMRRLLADPDYRKRTAARQERKAARERAQNEIKALREARRTMEIEALERDGRDVQRWVAQGLREGKSYADIAAEYGVSREYVRQVTAKASRGNIKAPTFSRYLL